MALDVHDLDRRTTAAVSFFWSVRASAIERHISKGLRDRGGRAGVTSGKNMDGFVSLIADVVRENGLGDSQLCLTRGVTTLPGYFRPTKDWDLLVIHKGALVAAIELKSQVGPSFGNNFNNRTEEAIGSATDLWTAYREGAFGDQPRPFLGWLTHVEDAAGSRSPVRVSEPHFPVLDGHDQASYLERYDSLCRRLVLERLYTEAAVIASTAEGGIKGEFDNLSEATSFKRFVISFAAHIAAEASRHSAGA